MRADTRFANESQPTLFSERVQSGQRTCLVWPRSTTSKTTNAAAATAAALRRSAAAAGRPGPAISRALEPRYSLARDTDIVVADAAAEGDGAVLDPAAAHVAAVGRPRAGRAGQLGGDESVQCMALGARHVAFVVLRRRLDARLGASLLLRAVVLGQRLLPAWPPASASGLGPAGALAAARLGLRRDSRCSGSPWRVRGGLMRGPLALVGRLRAAKWAQRGRHRHRGPKPRATRRLRGDAAQDDGRCGPGADTNANTTSELGGVGLIRRQWAGPSARGRARTEGRAGKKRRPAARTKKKGKRTCILTAAADFGRTNRLAGWGSPACPCPARPALRRGETTQAVAPAGARRAHERALLHASITCAGASEGTSVGRFRNCKIVERASPPRGARGSALHLAIDFGRRPATGLLLGTRAAVSFRDWARRGPRCRAEDRHRQPRSACGCAPERGRRRAACG